MSDDLRQAAKRLMEVAAMPIEKQKAHFREWPEFGWDGIMLARAYLAEHPEDDEEPVTEEWLRSVGFDDGGSGFFEIGVACVCLWEGRKDAWCFYFDGCCGPDPLTRGDVRRLCAALGIPLKEGTS